MEIVKHVVELALLVGGICLVAVAGGWALSMTDRVWDKEELREEDQPIDLSGWRW